MRKAPEIMKIELYTFKVFRAITQLSFLIDYYIKGKAAREFKFKLLHWGGGGGVTTLFYTTLLPFCVWCSKKCSKKGREGTLSYTFFFTLNYTILDLSSQNLIFLPIIFHQFSHITFLKLKHTLYKTKM